MLILVGLEEFCDILQLQIKPEIELVVGDHVGDFWAFHVRRQVRNAESFLICVGTSHAGKVENLNFTKQRLPAWFLLISIPSYSWIVHETLCKSRK